jgi:hypothetical protein
MAIMAAASQPARAPRTSPRPRPPNPKSKSKPRKTHPRSQIPDPRARARAQSSELRPRSWFCQFCASLDSKVQLLNLRPTHHPTFFFLDFSFQYVLFLGVSRQGEFKNIIQIFLRKVHDENFPQKNRQKKSMSGFPRLFWFYRVFECFSPMGVQKH